MEFNKLFNRLSKPRYVLSDGLPYWRERIFNGIAWVMFLLGTLVIIPNLIISWKSQSIVIFAFDSAFYLVILTIILFPSIGLKAKAYIFITSIYTLAITLLIFLGSFGPGLIWMIFGSVLIALMLGLSQTIQSIVINLLLVLVLALIIHLKLFNTTFFQTYDTLSWIAIGMNGVLISAVCSIPLSILIKGLEQVNNEEKRLKTELLGKNEQIVEEMEKAKEADRLKSSFLANLSHEIRTPMNAIGGFSELLQMETEETSSTVKSYAEQIFVNSEFLQYLINDIVDISLIEAGQVKIRSEQFTILQLMDELSSVIDSMVLRKKRPEVIITFADKSGITGRKITYDKTHLKQIILNFVTNSLKYTYKGSIGIICHHKNNQLVFQVKDTGVGIPEYEKEKIFTRFTKIERKENTLVQGMGIGLSIVKGLSDALGGKVWFDSEENKGSSFYYSFEIDLG